jgi:hypothetical protein
LNEKNGRLHNIPGKNCIELTSTSGEHYVPLFENRRKLLKDILTDILRDNDYQKYHDLAESALSSLSS